METQRNKIVGGRNRTEITGLWENMSNRENRVGEIFENNNG